MKTFLIIFCLFGLAFCSYNCGKNNGQTYSYEVKNPVVYKFTPTKK